MVKLMLAGCSHPIVERYDTAPEVIRGTCMNCYVRLIITSSAARRAGGRGGWEPDRPVAFVCTHPMKTPITRHSKITSGNWHEALCSKCGTVLRHPDGPGSWEEVVFSGYVISEEP